MSKRSKKAVILAILLLLSSAAVGPGAEPNDPNADESPTSESQGSFLDDPNLGKGSDLSLGSKELFVQMMLSVLLVVGLAVGALYLSKKVLPRVTRAAGKEIRVVETTYLGPRKALHLVQIGSQKLLIGSTNESIATLAHVGDAWLELPKQETDPTVSQ